MIERICPIPRSFDGILLLTGAAGVGKTSILKRYFQHGEWVELSQVRARPSALTLQRIRRQLRNAAAKSKLLVVDDFQQAPELRHEIGRLVDESSCQFVLSTRTLLREPLAAARVEMSGLVHAELPDGSLGRLLNHGYQPHNYCSASPREELETELARLRARIEAERQLRNIAVVLEFLRLAARQDGQLPNASDIARRCSVSSHTIQSYYEMLQQWLLGSWLNAYQRNPRRRVIRSPKFFFADIGLVNALTRRGRIELGSELYGKALANWVYHELRTYRAYRGGYSSLSYWRLASGIEVAFVLDDARVAIDLEPVAPVTSSSLKGLRQLTIDQPQVQQRLLLTLESSPRRTPDGITITNPEAFSRSLWNGELNE